MRIVLFSIALVFAVAGGSLSAYALARYRSPATPLGGLFSPRRWRPVWKTQDWFTERRGFLLYCVGIELLSLGALLGFVGYLFL